jgi:hypothetical protein
VLIVKGRLACDALPAHLIHMVSGVNIHSLCTFDTHGLGNEDVGDTHDVTYVYDDVT